MEEGAIPIGHSNSQYGGPGGSITGVTVQFWWMYKRMYRIQRGLPKSFMVPLISMQEGLGESQTSHTMNHLWLWVMVSVSDTSKLGCLPNTNLSTVGYLW